MNRAEKSTPYTYRLNTAEKDAVCELMGAHNCKTESDYLRMLVHQDARLFARPATVARVAEARPPAVQAALVFAPVVQDWNALGAFVAECARADIAAGVAPPTWTGLLVAPREQLVDEDVITREPPPPVCCQHPRVVGVGALLLCDSCEAELTPQAAASVCRWRGRAALRAGNLGLHREYEVQARRHAEAAELEHAAPELRRARRDVARMYGAKSAPAPDARTLAVEDVLRRCIKALDEAGEKGATEETLIRNVALDESVELPAGESARVLVLQALLEGERRGKLHLGPGGNRWLVGARGADPKATLEGARAVMGALGAVCVCGHLESKHSAGDELFMCTVENCYCDEFSAPRAGDKPFAAVFRKHLGWNQPITEDAGDKLTLEGARAVMGALGAVCVCGHLELKHAVGDELSMCLEDDCSCEEFSAPRVGDKPATAARMLPEDALRDVLLDQAVAWLRGVDDGACFDAIVNAVIDEWDVTVCAPEVRENFRRISQEAFEAVLRQALEHGQSSGLLICVDGVWFVAGRGFGVGPDWPKDALLAVVAPRVGHEDTGLVGEYCGPDTSGFPHVRLRVASGEMVFRVDELELASRVVFDVDAPWGEFRRLPGDHPTVRSQRAATGWKVRLSDLPRELAESWLQGWRDETCAPLALGTKVRIIGGPYSGKTGKVALSEDTDRPRVRVKGVKLLQSIPREFLQNDDGAAAEPGSMPVTTATKAARRAEKKGTSGPVSDAPAPDAWVLRCKHQGAGAAVAHTVERFCVKARPRPWVAVCGVKLQAPTMPGPNATECQNCVRMRESQSSPGAKVSDLPRIEGWVRVWDGKHDVAHTRRADVTFGALSVCNVVVGGSNWRPAPATTPDCVHCAAGRCAEGMAERPGGSSSDTPEKGAAA